MTGWNDRGPRRRVHAGRYVLDMYGDYTEVHEVDTTGMIAPRQHLTCGAVIDEAACERIARYADCDIYRCTNCGGQCDNRPVGWGGNVERVR